MAKTKNTTRTVERVNGQDVQFWFKRATVLRNAVLMYLAPDKDAPSDDAEDAERFYQDQIRYAAETLDVRATTNDRLRQRIDNSVGPLDKVQRQRIANALLSLADDLRTTRSDQTTERLALNLTLASDYIELARSFLPADVLDHGAKAYAEVVERTRLKDEAAQRIAEVGKDETRLALAK